MLIYYIILHLLLPLARADLDVHQVGELALLVCRPALRLVEVAPHNAAMVRQVGPGRIHHSARCDCEPAGDPCKPLARMHTGQTCSRVADPTATTRDTGLRRSGSSSSDVRRKWPRWFACSCSSKPSSVRTQPRHRKMPALLISAYRGRFFALNSAENRRTEARLHRSRLQIKRILSL